eukprot:364271-Chlamydomonas_euryale.AAC.19
MHSSKPVAACQLITGDTAATSPHTHRHTPAAPYAAAAPAPPPLAASPTGTLPPPLQPRASSLPVVPRAPRRRRRRAQTPPLPRSAPVVAARRLRTATSLALKGRALGAALLPPRATGAPTLGERCRRRAQRCGNAPRQLFEKTKVAARLRGRRRRPGAPRCRPDGCPQVEPP